MPPRQFRYIKRQERMASQRQLAQQPPPPLPSSSHLLHRAPARAARAEGTWSPLVTPPDLPGSNPFGGIPPRPPSPLRPTLPPSQQLPDIPDLLDLLSSPKPPTPPQPPQPPRAERQNVVRRLRRRPEFEVFRDEDAPARPSTPAAGSSPVGQEQEDDRDPVYHPPPSPPAWLVESQEGDENEAASSSAPRDGAFVTRRANRLRGRRALAPRDAPGDAGAAGLAGSASSSSLAPAAAADAGRAEPSRRPRAGTPIPGELDVAARLRPSRRVAGMLAAIDRAMSPFRRMARGRGSPPAGAREASPPAPPATPATRPGRDQVADVSRPNTVPESERSLGLEGHPLRVSFAMSLASPSTPASSILRPPVEQPSSVPGAPANAVVDSPSREPGKRPSPTEVASPSREPGSEPSPPHTPPTAQTVASAQGNPETPPSQLFAARTSTPKAPKADKYGMSKLVVPRTPIDATPLIFRALVDPTSGAAALHSTPERPAPPTLRRSMRIKMRNDLHAGLFGMASPVARQLNFETPQKRRRNQTEEQDTPSAKKLKVSFTTISENLAMLDGDGDERMADIQDETVPPPAATNGAITSAKIPAARAHVDADANDPVRPWTPAPPKARAAPKNRTNVRQKNTMGRKGAAVAASTAGARITRQGQPAAAAPLAAASKAQKSAAPGQKKSATASAPRTTLGGRRGRAGKAADGPREPTRKQPTRAAAKPQWRV